MISIQMFPIDDLKTYELFQRGETVGFSVWKSWNAKYMKVKPTVFPDLIDECLVSSWTYCLYSEFRQAKKMVKRKLFMTWCLRRITEDTYGLRFIKNK
jgi:DNA polymerase-3 subunit alpha